LRKGGHNAGADLEKLCEPVSHMEMPLILSGFARKFFYYLKLSFCQSIDKHKF